MAEGVVFKTDTGRKELLHLMEDIHTFIEDIVYKVSGFSDHKMMWKVDFNMEEKGSGVWILNTENLKSKIYNLKIKKIACT